MECSLEIFASAHRGSQIILPHSLKNQRIKWFVDDKRKLIGEVFLKEKKGSFVEILKMSDFSVLIYRKTECCSTF